MLKDNVKNYFYLHLIVFIWGFTAILGNLISLDAVSLVWYRVVLSNLVLLIYFAVRGESIRTSKKSLLLFLLAGFVIAIHWLAFFWAIKISNVSITLACLSTGAFFASILEPIFYKRKVDLYEVFFGIVVIVAVVIIFSVENQYVWGIVLALIAAFLSALFSVINGKFAKKYNASIITFYELLGGILLLSFFLFISGSFNTEFFQVSDRDWFWLLILSVFCTTFPFLATVKIMKYLSPYTVMLTINLEPVYGILLAVLIFKDSEKMTPEFYVGAFLIFITVILNGIVKNRKKRKLIKE